jgi:peptide/nickel transport system permease protein
VGDLIKTIALQYGAEVDTKPFVVLTIAVLAWLNYRGVFMTLTVNFVITAFAFVAIIVLFFAVEGVGTGGSILRHREMLTDLPYGWIGVLAALRHNTWVDQALMTVALLGVSLPNFWLGLVLILVFSVHLGWLPTGGYVEPSANLIGWLRSATLPAVSLALLQIGLLARITRSAMLEVLRQDYIRTARAKGLPEFMVIVKHAMANVAIPVVTVVGLIFSVLLSGSIIIETVFSVPGMGALLGNAILRRDYPMIQGGLLFVATALMLLNILVDVAYAWFDPRVRVDGGR